jgi:hypothetical protein
MTDASTSILRGKTYRATPSFVWPPRATSMFIADRTGADRRYGALIPISVPQIVSAPPRPKTTISRSATAPLRRRYERAPESLFAAMRWAERLR